MVSKVVSGPLSAEGYRMVEKGVDRACFTYFAKAKRNG